MDGVTQYWKVFPRAVIEKIITARGNTFPDDGTNVFIQDVVVISFAVGSTCRKCRTPLGIEKIMPLGRSAFSRARGCVWGVGVMSWPVSFVGCYLLFIYGADAVC